MISFRDIDFIQSKEADDGGSFGLGRIFPWRRLNCWDIRELRWVDILE